MFFRVFKFKKITLMFFILLFIPLILFYYIYANTLIYYWDEESNSKGMNYIKWVEFTPSVWLLEKTSNIDIKSHNENWDIKINWIELLAYLSAKYYGNLDKFKQSDLDNLVQRLKEGKTIEELTSNLNLYDYYYESYNAILCQFIGDYEVEIENNGIKQYEGKYGIKAFLPIAKKYSFSHYKDFGNSRSYGYRRRHLGNDLMGSIGTPIIAVESGIIEAIGWNQYGGWRIGIRSFDKKRYYYYAHLRKDHPFNNEFKEGDIVKAGDVIGYLGMTGYSLKENVNNINVPHLHFGMQIIFDESQKDGINQIWIDVYNIIEFLRKHRSEVYLDKSNETKDYVRKYDIIDPVINK